MWIILPCRLAADKQSRILLRIDGLLGDLAAALLESERIRGIIPTAEGNRQLVVPTELQGRPPLFQQLIDLLLRLRHSGVGVRIRHAIGPRGQEHRIGECRNDMMPLLD